MDKVNQCYFAKGQIVQEEEVQLLVIGMCLLFCNTSRYLEDKWPWQ